MASVLAPIIAQNGRPRSRGLARFQDEGCAKSVIWLSLVMMVLGVVAAGAGLFWTTEGAAYSFTTPHGCCW